MVAPILLAFMAILVENTHLYAQDPSHPSNCILEHNRLDNLDAQIAQTTTKFVANVKMLKAYWEVGRLIVEEQKKKKWGEGVVDKFIKSIKINYPEIKGFSDISIYRMRAFYLAYKDIAQELLHVEDLPSFAIPWRHNIILLGQTKNIEERLWYAQQAIRYGWSSKTLKDSIKVKLFEKEGRGSKNFKNLLGSLINQSAIE